jgi:4-diphosphocytidyl-2-C-methyl-D-erythritol kinase
MMLSITLPSPPKLNLFLHITGRRDDGYHNLQTLFQLLDGGDQLTFTATNNSAIRLSPQIDGVAEEDNLIVRAARALQEKTGSRLGCSIVVDKKLPMGAGLGGGSSNAATTLLALNRLWALDLPLTELAEIGATLGADVPVFVIGRSAFAEGIGDDLSPFDIPDYWYLVITPPCKVSTGEIFSNPQLTRHSLPIKIRALSEEQYRNDCQAVVEELYPQVKEVVEWIRNFATPMMTGTGASVFCRWKTQAEANRVLATVPQHWSAFVARGVNYSQVHQQLRDFFTGASPSG